MNKNGKISASMMCSSLGKLPDTIHLFEEENIDYLHIDVMDGVNILHVTPGFAGQKAVEGTVEKTGTVIERIKSLGLHDYIIEVDGNITFERAKILRDLGANMFVAGSSSIFKGDISDYRDNIRELRKSII